MSLASTHSNVAPGEQQLHGVPFERIQRLTAFLDGRPPSSDVVDNLSGHLLLNDLTVAVAHVRAVTQLTAARIDTAAGTLKPVRNFLHRQAKIQEKVEQRKR
jgi:hypothetical protein